MNYVGLLVLGILLGGVAEKWTSNQLHKKLKPGEACKGLPFGEAAEGRTMKKLAGMLRKKGHRVSTSADLR